MYGERIEALIDAALMDGVLTEKERMILFKRAQAEGIDIDEFEMVLNARLIEMENAKKKVAPKSEKLGSLQKCPACGAMVTGGSAVCQDCGYAFNSSEALVSRERLYELIVKIDKEYVVETGILVDPRRANAGKASLKATAIVNFPVPNTRADLLDFLSFLSALANPSARKDYMSSFLATATEDLGYAYWQLYASCINKARISFAKDKSFAQFYASYERMMVEAKKFRLPDAAKIFILLGSLALFGIFLILLGLLLS